MYLSEKTTHDSLFGRQEDLVVIVKGWLGKTAGKPQRELLDFYALLSLLCANLPSVWSLGLPVCTVPNDRAR